MALTDECVRNFFIGLLLSIGFAQNVSPQYVKTSTQSNSVTWNGHSPLKDFWLPDCSDDSQKSEQLYFKLIKTLMDNNKALKILENSDIFKATASLKFEIVETPDNVTSHATFHLVLSTNKQVQDSTPESKTNVTNTEPQSHASKISSKDAGKATNFIEMVVERHNTYRKKHKAPNLVYSKKLSNISQEWANQLAKKDKFYHRPNNKYGENLYYIQHSDLNYQVPPNLAVDSWYSEVKFYNYSKSVNNLTQTGHFTQLVWKNSKQLGIGIAKNKNKHYIVCNYSPPGNVVGQYAENVLSPAKS